MCVSLLRSVFHFRDRFQWQFRYKSEFVYTVWSLQTQSSREASVLQPSKTEEEEDEEEEEEEKEEEEEGPQ